MKQKKEPNHYEGKICSRNKEILKKKIFQLLWGKEQKTKLEKYLSGKRTRAIRNERANLQLEKKKAGRKPR